MDWIQSIITTDNIAIALCIAGFMVVGYVFRLLWGKILVLELKSEADREVILKLTAEVNFIKGENSIVEAIDRSTLMLKKMDQKIDLLHQKKLNI